MKQPIKKCLWFYLVWIFHDKVFPIRQLHTNINDAPQDAPCVVHTKIDLVGELHWPELLSTQDHVLGRVPHVDTRHIPKETHKKLLEEY